MAIRTIVFLREAKYVTGDLFALSAFAFQSGLSCQGEKIVASYERFRINRVIVRQFLESTFGKEKFLCLRVEAIPAKTCTLPIMIGPSRAFLVVEVNPRWAGGRVTAPQGLFSYTDLNSVCYNSITEQGQMFWIAAARGRYGSQFDVLSMLSISPGI
jgi:hypothetical protein